VRSTYLQDPTIAEGCQTAINEAVRVKCVATTGKRSALSLQVVQTLLGLAVNNARTPYSPAACKGKRKKGVKVIKN
jgi:hypothetical protein